MELGTLPPAEKSPVVERKLSADYERIREAAIKILTKEIEEIENPRETTSQEVADLKEERIKNIQKVIDRLTDDFVLEVAETEDSDGKTWQIIRDASGDLTKTDEKELPQKLVDSARMAI